MNNKQISETLQCIKLAFYTLPVGQPARVDLENIWWSTASSLEEKESVFYLLQDQGALEILYKYTSNTRHEFITGFEVKVVQPAFNKLNEKFWQMAWGVPVKEPSGLILSTVPFEPSAELVTRAEKRFRYENHVLHFTLSDETTDTVDFESSRILRQILEAFLQLSKRTETNKFSSQEVIDVYIELFKEVITPRYLSQQISNIRNKKIKAKSNLKGRFAIDFDKATRKWNFQLN